MSINDTKQEQDNIVFQIVDWDYFHDENDEGNKNFCIRLFGRNKEQKTVYVQVNNFKPYFYIEINKNWRLSTIDKILDEVKKRVNKDCVEGLKSYKIEEKYKFWGFTNYKLFTFAKFTFEDYDSMKAYANAFTRSYKIYAIDRKNYLKFKLYESNILPVLRFMHIRQLEAVGWVSIPKKKADVFEYPPTCCELNYKTDWTNISKVDDRLIEKFVIASFDIECTSEDGSFPQPMRDGDKVIQIGITLSRYGEADCYYKHLLSLKETANIEGVTVEWFKTEEDLLLGFTKFIRKFDPDIITGYNIFGFDFTYLRQRSKKLGIENKFSRLSRINNEMSDWIESDLSSAALGKNILTYFKMTGRVIIDLMKVVQRDFKLSSYKLDSVASYFIREGVLTLEKDKKEKKFKVTTKNTAGVVKGDYVTICYVEGAVESKYNEGQKFKIVDIGKDFLVLDGEIDTDEFMDKGFKIFWCQAKDDISPNDIFRMADGSPEDRATVGKYCIMDCALCNKLIAKLQIITNNVSMANVCHVPLSYLFLRGQGVKIYSLVAKKCREKNHLIPVIKKKIKKNELQNLNDPKIAEKIKREAKFEKFITGLNSKQNDDVNEDDDDDVGYEGAIVFVPRAEVHYDPIPVLDYNSLYPNAMILRNLSHETYVDNPEYDNLPGYKYHEITYNNNDGTTTTCRFAEKLDGTKGIVPEILMDLLKARKDTRKMMETVKDYFLRSILDGLQLALKITANSLYGQTGSAVSPVGMKWIAASTTATGREMLIFSKHFIENMFSEMINLALTNKKKYYKKMNELYKYYPTNFDVGIRGANEKTGEEIQIMYNIHVHTGDDVEIPESKFIKGSIGYDLNYELYNEYKNTSSFYDAYVDTFKKINLDSLEKFNEKFVKALKNNSITDREDFCNDMKNLIVLDRGSRTKIYQNNKKIIKDMGFNEDSFKEKLCECLKFLKEDKKIEFFEALHDNIENMGCANKDELFERFYNVANRTLKGYTIKPEAIYGDSIVGDTPILIKKNNNEIITTIDTLGKNWTKYNGDKLQDDTIENCEIWSDIGWTKIKRVIKHKTNKKIYEILTNTGYVRVTEDHSLLDIYGTEISPKDCKIGTDLLHSFPKIFMEESTNMSNEMAYIYGFFLGGGSCGKYRTQYSWALNNRNLKLCNELKNMLVNIYNKNFKILDTSQTYGVYKVVPCEDIKLYVDEYINKFYDCHKNKIIPPEIFISSILLKEKFMEGFCDAKGDKFDTEKCGCHSFDQKDQISAMNFYCLLKGMGYNVSINKRSDKSEIFTLIYSFDTEINDPTKIKKIRKLIMRDRWVYDLETENHHFNAGVGELVVHNTDSVFFKMNIKDEETGIMLRDKNALKKSITFGMWASILIGCMLPLPMNMEYEKTLWPFIIQGKKRYVGNLYEKNINKFAQKSMGIELKRRDNAPIVKVACSGIIDQILNKHSSHGAYEFIKKLLQQIITGKMRKDKFVITKTLKGNALTEKERVIEKVKSKEQRSYADRTRIVHAVLADRMADRDPGNKPLSNDRIPYMYIETKTEPKLQGDRVETPEYIEANKLKVDYLFYITNQIMKPSLKFLDLIIENAEDVFREYIIKEENRKRCMMPITYYATGEPDDGEKDFDDIEDFIDKSTTKGPIKEKKMKTKKKQNEKKREYSKSMFTSMGDMFIDGDDPEGVKDVKPKKKPVPKKKKGSDSSGNVLMDDKKYISMNDLLE
jgi:DNA polymerase elongation subunit (family B)